MKIHEYNEMMAYLTRPGVDPSSEQQVAGLSESFPGTYTSYQDAVYNGFQGTKEEWLQQQSIPQIDRPLTGAAGGRVGKKPGGLVEPGVTHYATKDGKESHWSDWINPGEWAQGLPSEEVREDFKKDVSHAWDFAKHAGKELVKEFTPVQGEARAIGYALEEKKDLAEALQDNKYIKATGHAINTQLMSLSALPWWSPTGLIAKPLAKLARLGKTYANFANAKKLQKLELGTAASKVGEGSYYGKKI